MPLELTQLDLSKLDAITLSSGSHESPDAGLCALEAVAYIAGEPHTDYPACVSPVIAAFGRSWNDTLPDADRNRLLKPLLQLMVGTATTEADEETRAWMATDWLVRVHAPAFFDLIPSLADYAAKLRALPPLTSAEIAVAVQDMLAAAGDAAGAAAWADAWDAARDALAPTVATLQASAQDLVRRMCAVGGEESV